MAIRRGRSILKRQLESREKLWPGITNDRLWYRNERDGFVTIPRLMPLIMSIMDDLSGKGFPVGQTYLEMWCRSFDECFISLHKHEELAFHSGFSGQRAVRTWRDRVKRIAELKFIDLKSGPMGELSYALIWNPYHVIREHHAMGKVDQKKWNALVVRANEIGANDIDQILKDDSDDDDLPF